MHTIAVTPEVLKEQAKVYLEAKQMVYDAKKKVDTMNEVMADQWKGKAFEAYLQQFDALSVHVVQFMELLESINYQLTNYADTQAERDLADRSAFAAM